MEEMRLFPEDFLFDLWPEDPCCLFPFCGVIPRQGFSHCDGFATSIFLAHFCFIIIFAQDDTFDTSAQERYSLNQYGEISTKWIKWLLPYRELMGRAVSR
jgi:hypothetical protein